MGEPTKRSSPVGKIMSEQNTQQLINMDHNNSSSNNSNSGKAHHNHNHPLQSQRNSSSSLFLTLPSNFSPSSLSPRNSAGSGSSTGSSCGGVTPPTSTTTTMNTGQERKGSAPSRYSPSSHIQSYHPQYHHNYSWEDLRRLFLVSLEKLSRLEPESLPFRQPVDPVALGIPDYLDIIRKPMDLQTIRNKMNNGKYTDPWLYVDDVLRMVDNAWVYNREGSKVYEYSTVLAEVFQKEVNPVMYHLGYKQGRSNSFHFNSDTINCHGRPVCLILKGRGYYKDTSRDIEFNLCETCYQMKSEEMASSETGSVCSVTPDVVPNTPNHNQQQKSQTNQNQSQSTSSSSRPPSIVGPISPASSFVFTINSSKSYSPAAELHKSHMRDAEMSRQLVLREFLRMLLGSDTTTERKQNVFKMLRCNGKLMGEFIEYVKRRRSIVLAEGGEGCSVVYGESFTTRDLDKLLDKLKGLNLTPAGDNTFQKVSPSSAKRGSLIGGSSDNVSGSEEALGVVTSSSSTVSCSSDKENDYVDNDEGNSQKGKTMEELAKETEKRSTIGTLDSSGETIQDLSLESSSSCLSESVEDDTTCLLE